MPPRKAPVATATKSKAGSKQAETVTEAALDPAAAPTTRRTTRRAAAASAQDAPAAVAVVEIVKPATKRATTGRRAAAAPAKEPEPEIEPTAEAEPVPAEQPAKKRAGRRQVIVKSPVKDEDEKQADKQQQQPTEQKGDKVATKKRAAGRAAAKKDPQPEVHVEDDVQDAAAQSVAKDQKEDEEKAVVPVASKRKGRPPAAAKATTAKDMAPESVAPLEEKKPSSKRTAAGRRAAAKEPEPEIESEAAAAESVPAEPAKKRARRQVIVKSPVDKEEEVKQVEEQAAEQKVDKVATKKRTGRAAAKKDPEPEVHVQQDDGPDAAVAAEPVAKDQKVDEDKAVVPVASKRRGRPPAAAKAATAKDAAPESVAVEEKKTTAKRPAAGRRGAAVASAKEPVPEIESAGAEPMPAEQPAKKRGARRQPIVKSPVDEEEGKQVDEQPAQRKGDKVGTKGRAVREAAKQDPQVPDEAATVPDPVPAADVLPVVESKKDPEPEVEATAASEPIPEPEVRVEAAAVVAAVAPAKEPEPEMDPATATDPVAPIAEPEVRDEAAAVPDPVASAASAAPKKRLLQESPAYQPETKRVRQETIPITKRPDVSGRLLSCGIDSCGELGLRVLTVQKRRPFPIPSLDQEEFSLIAAGAMHSVAVNKEGTKVFTFGCNDESALGRSTAVNGEAVGTKMAPGPDENQNGDPDMTELVNMSDANDSIITSSSTTVTASEAAEAVPSFLSLPHPIVKVTAGDSHTAALTNQGTAFIWGCFRSQSGRIGLVKGSEPAPVPHPVHLSVAGNEIISDISSGDNHIVILTQAGKVFTAGVGEQGALGRISDADEAAVAKDLSNSDSFLIPALVRIIDEDDGNEVKCDKIWTGSFTSFARSSTTGSIYAWGLNNYSQLGFNVRKTIDKQEILVEWMPRKVITLSPDRKITAIAGGLHHTLFLDAAGHVYSCGRGHYGRLGHGDERDVTSPKLIESLKQETVNMIATGIDCSFAVCQSGSMYSWGPHQVHLGHTMPEEEGADYLVPRRIRSKNLESAVFRAVSVGASHTLVIATLNH